MSKITFLNGEIERLKHVLADKNHELDLKDQKIRDIEQTKSMELNSIRRTINLEHQTQYEKTLREKHLQLDFEKDRLLDELKRAYDTIN